MVEPSDSTSVWFLDGGYDDAPLPTWVCIETTNATSDAAESVEPGSREGLRVSFSHMTVYAQDREVSEFGDIAAYHVDMVVLDCDERWFYVMQTHYFDLDGSEVHFGAGNPLGTISFEDVPHHPFIALFCGAAPFKGVARSPADQAAFLRADLSGAAPR